MAINVLVVDDSATMRSMISRTLQMCQLPLGEILHAANGLCVTHKVALEKAAWTATKGSPKG